MQRNTAVVTASYLIIIAMSLQPLAAQSTDSSETQLRQVVQSYLHGLKFNDVASLKKAFYPEAKLFWVKKDGSLGQLTQDQWYKGFEASAGKEEEGDLKITALEITGNTASVKVEEQYPRSVYVDYLSLLKLGDGWKIVAKIYNARKK